MTGSNNDLHRRQATESMAARAATTDEDGADRQVGFDSPRSGITTPQPDVHDHRTPGISYFAQVRSASPSGQHSVSCFSKEDDHDASEASDKAQNVNKAIRTNQSSSSGTTGTVFEALKASGLLGAEASSTKSKGKGRTTDASQQEQSPKQVHLCSERFSALGQGCSDTLAAVVPLANFEGQGSSRSLAENRTGSDTSRSSSEGSGSGAASGAGSGSVHGPGTTKSESGAASRALPSGPSCLPRATQSLPAADVVRRSSSWFSLDFLMKLTRSSTAKSGTSTPTRALSVAGSSLVDPGALLTESAAPSRSQTPRPPQSQSPAHTQGAILPATKGKLTVSVHQTRGLESCTDPYLIVVFQRTESITKGKRGALGPADHLSTSAGDGTTIPGARHGSDASRPAMAIPARSRQSSSTNLADARNSARSPRPEFGKETESVFDVMESGDMAVTISVHDEGTDGEILVGRVQFVADKKNPIRGWFPIVNAAAGTDATTGAEPPQAELYIEATYQRTEKKHFGPGDFEMLRLIGKGTFGQVFQVRKKDTRRIYAMKILSKKVIVQKKEVAHTVGERNILVRTAMTDSPFIVSLKYSFQTPLDLYLVTDFLSGGELFWHLQKEGRFKEDRAKFYIAELVLAIQHLHSNDIVYRDLKPENILLDANGHIALCDFGLSKANLTKNETTSTFCGTTEYLAPEVLLDESGYTKMVDFWSLGVLVFEMCCGWSPFYAEDTQQMYKNIAFGKVRFPRETLSPEGRNFVKGLLNRNPRHRLGAENDAEELKAHPFFNDIDWDKLAKKQITPPFRPKLKSEEDVSYFDPEFTDALQNNGSLNERAAAMAKGIITSTPLSPSVQANFEGFTFVGESVLEDQMRRHNLGSDENDEDMTDRREGQDEDEAERALDDEWDNLEDVNGRQSNRMSGIVRTSTNEDNVFGDAQFEA